MAIVFTENFDSYTAGLPVAGQGNWTAVSGLGVGYNVSTTQSQSSPNSVAAANNLNGSTEVKTTFTAINSGNNITLSYYVYNDTSGVQAAYTLIGDASLNGWFVLMRSNNTWLLIDSNFSNALDNQFSWSSATWIHVEINVDLTNNQARFRVNGGAWSSYVVHSSTSVTSISSIALLQGANNSGTSYWDTMSVDNGVTPPPVNSGFFFAAAS